MPPKKKGGKESSSVIELATEITKLVIVANRSTVIKGFDYVGKRSICLPNVFLCPRIPNFLSPTSGRSSPRLRKAHLYKRDHR